MQVQKVFPVGTEDFRCLDWKRQLEIVKMKVFEPDKYHLEVLGSMRVDPQTAKMIDKLAFLMKEEARTIPGKDNFPITVLPHWIAADCWLKTTQEKILDDYGIGHDYFINTTLLKTPFLILPVDDFNLLKMAYLCQCKYTGSTNNGGSVGLDLCLYKTYVDLKLRGEFPKTPTDDSLISLLQESKKTYPVKGLNELFGFYPVIAPTEHSIRFTKGELLLYWYHKRETSLCVYIPMLPRNLQIHEDFRMANWHFLI